MSENKSTPYDQLARVFHEPNRLALMSTLASARNGLSFSDLKEACDLTDGNLSRHLKALQEAGAVQITKSFGGVKPGTTVSITADGRRQFTSYLEALEEVLRAAEKAVADPGAVTPPPAGKPAPA